MGARWSGLGQARPGGSGAGLLPYSHVSHVISSLSWTGGVGGGGGGEGGGGLGEVVARGWRM